MWFRNFQIEPQYSNIQPAMLDPDNMSTMITFILPSFLPLFIPYSLSSLLLSLFHFFFHSSLPFASVRSVQPHKDYKDEHPGHPQHAGNCQESKCEFNVSCQLILLYNIDIVPLFLDLLSPSFQFLKLIVLAIYPSSFSSFSLFIQLPLLYALCPLFALLTFLFSLPFFPPSFRRGCC